jgi:hypothetical protein
MKGSGSAEREQMADNFRWYFTGLTAVFFTPDRYIGANGQQTTAFLSGLAQVQLAGRKKRG